MGGARAGGRHTLFVSWNDSTPGRRSPSGTKTSLRKMSAFWTQRRAVLFSILRVVNPGMPLRTMNAFTCATGLSHHNQHSRAQRRHGEAGIRRPPCISPPAGVALPTSSRPRPTFAVDTEHGRLAYVQARMGSTAKASISTRREDVQQRR